MNSSGWVSVADRCESGVGLLGCELAAGFAGHLLVETVAAERGVLEVGLRLLDRLGGSIGVEIVDRPCRYLHRVARAVFAAHLVDQTLPTE